MIVLDEADEMLSAGFKEQVYNIFNFLNSSVQVCLFSATMPEELHALASNFLRNPVKILVKSEQLTLEGIVQHLNYFLNCYEDTIAFGGTDAP